MSNRWDNLTKETAIEIIKEMRLDRPGFKAEIYWSDGVVTMGTKDKLDTYEKGSHIGSVGMLAQIFKIKEEDIK